jgi:hypothetical protein
MERVEEMQDFLQKLWSSKATSIKKNTLYKEIQALSAAKIKSRDLIVQNLDIFRVHDKIRKWVQVYWKLFKTVSHFHIEHQLQENSVCQLLRM